MAATDAPQEARKKGAAMPIVIGLVLAAALGGAGFFAAYSGLLPIPGSGPAPDEAAEGAGDAMPEQVEFVPLDPMIVSLGSPGRGRLLRFRAEVEIVPGRGAEVRAVMPRLLDTLNGYLRAVPIEELETPSALVRLRSQMLRRLQLVAPQGAVRDLLIMEFVLD